ncbi:MAG: DUF362 domain-containing protein [Elusimicrobiota bacterium]|jgi:uncharacterized Fe-S center protein|nr:DUF362 domain-containing protein [Elusimicrobiota bacterium]
MNQENKKQKSDVYFSTFRAVVGDSLLDKLKRLIVKAGIDKIDFKNKFTAIKIHFGEPGNLAFIRPNFARVVVDLIKEKGGKSFLTDCNTLYVGGRKNALDHIDAAYQNGFSPFSTNAHVIIADGLKGTDESIVEVKDGLYVKQAKIGRAVMDADIVISLNHFKGHELTGFGGAIKNIGMGCGSRAGKMEMHSAGKPSVDQSLCIGCGACIRICAHSAPKIVNKKSFIDKNKCVGCGRCIGVCPVDAIEGAGDESNEILNYKMAEYAAAVVRGRPSFHITLAMDISPCCDCHGENDIPIVADIGMFASFDPVAIDQACVDAVNKQPVLAGSCLAEKTHHCQDRFTDTHPTTDWKGQIEHAQKLGLGTKEYNLIEI